MAKLALIWSKIQMQHDSLPGKLQEVTEQVPGTQSCISNSTDYEGGKPCQRPWKSNGRQGLGTVNDNGERLKEICDFNEMVITGTVFPHKKIHKQTWLSPDGRTKKKLITLWLTENLEHQYHD